MDYEIIEQFNEFWNSYNDALRCKMEIARGMNFDYEAYKQEASV